MELPKTRNGDSQNDLWASQNVNYQTSQNIEQSPYFIEKMIIYYNIQNSTYNGRISKLQRFTKLVMELPKRLMELHKTRMELFKTSKWDSQNE